MTPRFAYIIVSYNTCELLQACLQSIARYTRESCYEVIVVDNDSKDGSADMVREQFPHVILVESGGNLGFGRANNLGFSRTSAPYVVLLNSDAELLEDTGSALVDFLEKTPGAGIVGPEVLLRDGSRQEKTCGMLPTARVMFNQNLLLSVAFPRSRFFSGLYVEANWGPEVRMGWVSGVCMAITRDAYVQTKGFDPEIFMYAEDVDLCQRAYRLGWETWRLNAYPVRHCCGGSTKTEESVVRNRVRQQRNFMRLLDKSMGPVGRLVTRMSYVVGLGLRAALRVPAVLAGRQGHRLALRADLHCLADLLRVGSLAEDHHANRA